ncbi:MAG: LCP family protein [Propionibacteriaceae bacterium]|jgi:LCP family protein required for cell wall assembly|nr:LCP family protein [Propionibacteriaceae bacterium]
MADKHFPNATSAAQHAADLEWLYGGKNPPSPAPAATPGTTAAAVSDAAPDWDLRSPKPGAQSPHKPAKANPTPDATPAATKRFAHPIRNTGLVILALVLAWGAFMVFTPFHAWGGVERVDNTPTTPRPADTPGTLFLLVGGDSRDAMTPEEREKYGTGDAEGNRTDTVLLYYIPPEGPPALISLPRDSYLDIPGYGPDKLNAAYAYGGAALLTATVEQFTGLRIDGYLEISMVGFAKLVDYVGGINVCLDEDVSDGYSGLDLSAGCHDLDGRLALAYVRMRYADPRGDLGRVERQRETISLVAKKLAVTETVTLPWRWWDTTHELVKLVTAGNDTSLGQLWSAARGGLKFISGEALQFTAPIADPDVHTDAGSSVLLDATACTELFAEIAAGDTSQLKRFTAK